MNFSSSLMSDDVLLAHLEKLAEFNKTFIIVDMFQPDSKSELRYAHRHIRDSDSFEKLMKKSGLTLHTYKSINKKRYCSEPCDSTCNNRTPMPLFQLYVYTSDLCLHKTDIHKNLFHENGWVSELLNSKLGQSDKMMNLDVAHFFNGINGF